MQYPESSERKRNPRSQRNIKLENAKPTEKTSSYSSGYMPTYFSVSQPNKKTFKKAKRTKAPAVKKSSPENNSSYPPPTYPYYGKGNHHKNHSTNNPPPRKKKKSWVMIGMVLLLFIFFLLGGYYLIHLSAVKPYENIFYPNIYINGIDVGGKTIEEAQNIVHSNYQSFIDQFSVKLTYNNSLYDEVTSSRLGIHYDQNAINEELNQAWQIGHSQTNVFKKKEVLDQQFKEPTYFSAGDLTKDTTYIENLLSRLEEDVYFAPIDAGITFTHNPQDPFSFQAGQAGRAIDTEPVKEQLFKHIEKMESGEIKLDNVVSAIEPTTSTSDLQGKIELRGSFETEIAMHTRSENARTNTENRKHNIEVSMEAINVEIPNGKRFSFNDIVGERTTAANYLDAIEYVYGDAVWGTGGGVCQSSTTIYMAAIRAGMDIKERHSHSMPVGYVNVPGQDATVYMMKGHELDLVFENNSGASIYIVGNVYKNAKGKYICKVDIYGAPTNGITYDIRTEQEIIPIPEEIKIKKDTKQEYLEHVQYTDDPPYIIPGREGLIIKRYLIKYENGVEIGVVKDLGKDTYKAKNEQHIYGITERPFE